MRQIRLVLILKVYDRPMTVNSIHRLYNKIYQDDKMMGYTCTRLMEELRLKGKVKTKMVNSVCGNQWKMYTLNK